MQGRNTLAAILLVIAGAAYNTTSGPQSRSVAPTPGAAGKGTPAQVGEDEDQSPWKTLDLFIEERQRNADPEFLIAIVPDPFNTHLSLLFDRSIQSVQEAATAAGYTVDRYWLPWQDNPYNSTDKPEVLRLQEAEKSAREDQPGLLLFRGRIHDLAVFLIGEAPTTGINVSAFRSAIERIPSSSQPVRVAGPSFSGSLPSLQAAIERYSGRNFKVVSGTTTSTDAQRVFAQSVDFHSTVHTDDMAGDAFLIYLDREFDRRQAGPVSVAVLSEGDTPFGHDFSVSLTPWKPKHLRVLKFSFPRDIARLRNAYKDDFLAVTTPEPYRTAPQTGISLTLKDPSAGHDNVPKLSHHTPVSQEAALLGLAATLLREEVEYAAIAATDPLDTFFLSRFLTSNCPNIRLYQLDADLLFVRPPESLPLAGMLSVTTYPLFVRNQQWSSRSDGRMVFSSRYSEGIYNASLSLLGKSQVPLIEYTSPWNDSRGWHGPPLWLTAVGRGGYWPVALLAEEPDPHGIMLHHAIQREPGAAPTAEEPGHLFFVLVMAMTLAVAGLFLAIVMSRKSGSAWTSDFKIFINDVSLSKSAVNEPAGSAASATGAYVVAPDRPHLTAFGAAAAPALAREPVVPESTRMAEQIPSSQFVARERVGYMSICTLSLAAISLCVAAPLWKLFPPLESVRLAISYQVPSYLLVLFPFATALYLTFRPGRVNRLTVAAWLGFALTVALGFHLLAPDESRRDFFMAYRSLQLTSGLAPNIPMLLLFAACAAWGRAHWRRRVLMEDRKQTLPRLPALGFGNHLKTSEGAVSESVDEVGKDWKMLLASVLIGGATFFVSLDHLRTLERASYDFFYSAALGLVTALIFLTSFHFMKVWVRLEGLLGQIELHPIRSALSDLPPDRTWSPIWQGNGRNRSHILLTRSVDCLRAIKSPASRELLLELESSVDEVVRQVSTNRSESEAQVRATAVSLEIAERIAVELEGTYWSEGSSETLQEANSREMTQDVSRPSPEEWALAKPHKLAAEFVALRVLAYVRYVMLHLSNLLSFLTTGFVLTVLSLSSYPFQSRQMIGALNLTLFGALVAIVVWFFVRMNGNATLKRISSSDKDKRDWSLGIHILETGALPLLVLISSNVPGVGQFVFSWLQPVLERLH